MENEKIERIKNPKLSAGRIPDLLKASIMESQKKLTLVQKKDVITLHLQFKDLGYKKLSQLVAKKLGFPISKSAVRDIIKKKNDILETTTSEKTTRTWGRQPNSAALVGCWVFILLDFSWENTSQKRFCSRNASLALKLTLDKIFSY